MLFAELPAFFNARWSRRSVGLVLAFVLATTGLVVANAQGATAQSENQSAAERCSEFHLFGAQPVDVAKTADGQTVLAQVSWGWHESIGCYLALDGNAVAALRAAGPPDSLPQGTTDASRRCFAHHRFGAQPVDVAKTADGQTVLARLNWGRNESIGCYLALDSSAINTLRVAATPPATAPGAPANVEATAGDSRLTITWTAPADNGGALITGYTVAYKANAFTCPTPNTVGTWTVRTTSNTSITIGGLANDHAYRLCVRASNSAGSGGWNGTTSSPSDRPGQPTGVQFTGAGPDQLTVAWTAPATTGGSAITGYTVQWCTAWATRDVCASSWSSASAAGTSHTIAGLIGNTSYGVRVQAVNSRGTGSWSITRFATTAAANPPGTPSGLRVTIDDRQIALSWNAPPSNGAPITRYTVECRNDGSAETGSCRSTNWAQYTTTPSTSTTISGLVNGNAYSVRISATNSAGTSSAAETQATPAARPRIPTGVDASTSGRNIQVTWTAPASGGSPISSYTVEFCSGGCTSWRSTTVSGNPPATTTTLTGLTTGTTYRVRVQAVNAAGESGWSTADTATTPTRPGTPSGVIITNIDNDELTATWTAPAQPGSGVSHYNVQRCTARANNNGTWSCSSGWSNAGTATDTSHDITGLTGDTAYLVRVQAANAAGTSGWSTAGTATITAAPAAPDTPSNLAATPGNRQIRLSWTAPAANGAPITRYTIECQGSRTNGTHRCDDDKNDNNTYTTSGTSYTFYSLTNGDQYTFTLSATNVAGTSSTTQISDTPATRPGRPTNITITETYPGNGGVNLGITWDVVADDDNGGTAITGYTVQYRASNGNWSFVYFGLGTSASVNGLTVGPRYYIQIRSHNAVGESSWVQASSDPTGTPAKPDAPTLSDVNRGDMTANWSAPDQGASAITDYDVQWCTARERTVTVDGNQITTYPCTGSWRTAPDDDIGATDSSYQITGLNGSTRYSVRVRAVNIHGNGPWSDVGSDTTQAPDVPNAPTLNTPVPGSGQIRLSWTAPNANGARITSYRVECRNDGNATTGSCKDSDWTQYATPSGTSTTISSLVNGNAYSIRVSALNSAGRGPSSETSATPATRPGRPDADDITITETYENDLVTLSVSWVEPDDTGGHPEGITGYTLQYRVSGSHWSFEYFGTNTQHDITGLAIGPQYDMQIRTHNAVGESSWTQVSRTPTGRPAKPTISSVSGGTNDLSVSWSEPSGGASSIISYNVQRCNASETTSGNNTTYRCTSGWTSAGTTTSTSFEISNLACGTRYGVRVQAVNSYGAGPWSDIDRTRADWSGTTNDCPDN